MALQVRLRHAMGERVLEIAATPADRPFVVGRGSDANLVVPSTSVAQRQCLLFVHDGRWIAQEWTPGGTRINGKPPAGPTPLSVGDVLTIGADASAATLEIDPGGATAGRKGSPAFEGARMQEAKPATAPAARPRPAPAPAAGLRPAPGTALRPAPVAGLRPAPAIPARPRPAPAAAAAAPASPPPQPRQSQATAFGDDTIDWAPTLESAEEIKRPRPRKKSSVIPLLICLLLGGGIVGGTGWFVWKRMQSPQVVIIDESKLHPAAPKIAPPASAPSASAAKGADDDGLDPGDAATGASAAADPDAASTDVDWTDVIVAHDAPDPGPAIVRYDDYHRRNPGKHEKTLRHFEAEAYDRMWWRRITQLCHRRVRLAVELEAKNTAIRQENDPPSKASLQSEKAAIEQDAKTTTDALHNDMGFNGADPPDLGDESAIATARAARNKVKYGDWCRDIGAYVRNHAGATPWGDEDL